MKELKDCPKCGANSEDIVIGLSLEGASIRCLVCDYEGPRMGVNDSEGVDAAMEAWDNRVYGWSFMLDVKFMDEEGYQFNEGRYIKDVAMEQPNKDDICSLGEHCTCKVKEYDFSYNTVECYPWIATSYEQVAQYDKLLKDAGFQYI